MKKSLLMGILFLTCAQFIGQGWVDIGVKGGWGPTFLFNQNIFDDGSYNHQVTTKGGFGGKLGYNFNQDHEITFDFMANGFGQDFKFNVTTDTSSNATTEHTSNISYKSFDFLLMYRNNADGKYFEIGPVLSNIRSVSRTSSDLASGTDADFTMDKVNKMQSGVALGFGAYFMGTDNFGITGGLRISYMFSDLISAEGKNWNYPTGNTYETYKPSHPLLVQLVFEANLDFAYMAKANCGRRKLLMF